MANLFNLVSRLKQPAAPTPVSAVQPIAGLNKADPGMQVRSALSASTQATAPKLSDLHSNLNSLSDWSDQQTSLVRQTALQKKAERAAQKSAVQLRSAGSGTRGEALTSQIDLSGLQMPASGARAQLVNRAVSMVGIPYSWGGGGYGRRTSTGVGQGRNVVGVDCSGLTQYVYGTLGIKLPRTANQQLKASGYKTAVQNLQPGDLIGWSKGGHVAMYLGNGKIAEAVKPGVPSRVRSLSASDYRGGVYGVRIKLPGE